MKDKILDMDAILKKSLASNEKPAPELVNKVKNKILEERYSMKNKGIRRFSVAALAAMIAVLSLTIVAAAAPPIWRHVQTRIIEGEQYVQDFRVMESDDGMIIQSYGMIIGETGRVVAEIDGVETVISDPLVLYDLDEARRLLQVDAPLLPTFLPDGFYLKNATFPVCPQRNPDAEHAGQVLVLNFTNGYEDFIFTISHNEREWGLGVWASNLDEITIGGHDGLIGGGGLALQIGEYTRIMIILQDLDGAIGYNELIRIAESLR